MRKTLAGLMAVACMISMPVRQAAAQLAKGYSDIGGVVGFGNTGGAGVSLGGRFERVLKDLPDMGGGTLGIGVSADYWRYDYGNYYRYSYLPIGVTGNYHVKLENKKVDVFGGVGLGYNIIGCSYSGPAGTLGDLCQNGSIYLIARAGGRYFLSDKSAIYGDVGAGASALNIGLTFKIK